MKSLNNTSGDDKIKPVCLCHLANYRLYGLSGITWLLHRETRVGVPSPFLWMALVSGSLTRNYHQFTGQRIQFQLQERSRRIRDYLGSEDLWFPDGTNCCLSLANEPLIAVIYWKGVVRRKNLHQFGVCSKIHWVRFCIEIPSGC